MGYLVGAVALFALLGAAWVWFASSRAMGSTHEGVPESLPKPRPAQLADAPRQLKILGCITCHGAGLRGHLMFDEPGVARIHAPNLTLIAARATDQQLARAIRQGIGFDGRPLFVMPSAQYARLEDGEVAALIAAIRSLPKGGKPTPAISVGPLGRFGLATGKLSSQPDEVERFRINMPAELGPPFAQGRKLAMVNCAECHGPAFGGGEMEGHKVPDLAIVGAYDLDQFKRLMREGVPPSKRDLGLMSDVARKDFRHFKDEEIAALHSYLQERARRAP
ncbi:MAG TPA: c-type cytochrome [Sphingomicrobium sp.]|nr:c-type cytochrome [Sphingomicrobium sp.]